MEPIGLSMSAAFSKEYRACPLEAVAIETSYRRNTALASDSLGCPEASSSGNINSDNRILIRKNKEKKGEGTEVLSIL
ncbi:hypothetical protein CIPAW_04G016800 [Carya illinoinensis]|uniref:Uncharacterized protein n=1 Tax=Carya illinoinensis TaxID=32201 RepID=A0A8T1QQ43_CARIL|nr:hypothetical protein CIPAW_04G016800 [Carya illinoinensis]